MNYPACIWLFHCGDIDNYAAMIPGQFGIDADGHQEITRIDGRFVNNRFGARVNVQFFQPVAFGRIKPLQFYRVDGIMAGVPVVTTKPNATA